MLVVTFSNGNLACFNGVDGSVITIGSETTYGQSIIANRRYFFKESVSDNTKAVLSQIISDVS